MHAGITSEVSINETPSSVATRVHGVADEQAGSGALKPVAALQALLLAGGGGGGEGGGGEGSAMAPEEELPEPQLLSTDITTDTNKAFSKEIKGPDLLCTLQIFNRTGMLREFRYCNGRAHLLGR